MPTSPAPTDAADSSDEDGSRPSSPKVDRILALVVVAAAFALAAQHLRLLQFICDDSFISFRYSRNFAEGLGLVYNEGERVEGYTNFLWVVLVAAGIKVGLTAETWSVALGLFLLVGAAWVLGREMARATGRLVYGAMVALLIAATGPIMLWSGSGLESICFATLALVASVHTARHLQHAKGLFVAGLFFALATMTRPDGVIFGGTAGAFVLGAGIVGRWSVLDLMRRAGALAGGFATLFGPFMAWRISYYDDVFPNTYYVKSGSVNQAEMGLRYLQSFVTEYPVLWVLSLVGLGAALCGPLARSARPVVVMLAMAGAAFALYVVWAGGDYMALYRFMVPVLPALLFFTTLSLWSLERATARLPGPARAALVTVAAAAVCWFTYQPSLDSANGIPRSPLLNTQSMMSQNTHKWTTAGRILGDALWDGARISTTAAGALPYASGVYTLDQSGLCDKHTAKVDSDPWLLHKPGHKKQATREYMITRDPPIDLILHHPQIMKQAAMSIPPPSPDYETRALKLDDLTDHEGDPLFLYFLLHKSRFRDAAMAGMVDPRAWR